MPTYTYLTQAQFLTLLASRLYDTGEKLFTHAEKTLYLAEALRTWNALTAMWRSDFTIPTVLNARWYDISGTAQTGVTAAANTTRPLTLHDTDLYTPLQYALLEPVAWSPWTGVSTQFSAADLTAAVQARRDELLSISGAFITYRTVTAVPGRVTLPDPVIDVRRVAYVPGSSLFTGTLIQSLGGSSTLKYQVTALLHSTLGRNYTATMQVQNTAAVPVTVTLTLGASVSSQVVAPRSFASVSIGPVGPGDGSTSVRLQVSTQSAGDALSLIAANPVVVDTLALGSNLLSGGALTFKSPWTAQSGAAITLTQGVPSVAVQASAMWPEDAWSVQSFNRLYTAASPGTPLSYLMSTQPPISFDPDRLPGFDGAYEVLTVDAGLATSEQTPTPLMVPDDWAHVIKYGALATLLGRESLAADPVRAQYAAGRYKLGARLLSDAPALLAARIANVPVQVDAVRHADQFRTLWEAETVAAPNAIYVAGLNLIAIAPPPDMGPYALTATVVANAPIPANDADFVQVSRDDLDAILDLCTHIAMFKLGGSEFTDTLPLFDRFMRQAALYNSKLLELGELTAMLLGTGQMEASAAPRMTPDAAEVT